MGGSTLDTIPMVDAALACLMINIKAAEVVVEIHRTCTEVAAEKGGMSREDGGHVDMALAAKRDAHASEPLMEMGDDCSVALMRDKLFQDNEGQVCEKPM